MWRGLRSWELAKVLTASSACGLGAARGWTPSGASRGLRCPCALCEGEPHAEA